MKKPIKLISLILSLLLFFAFAGCDIGYTLLRYKTAAKAGLETYAKEGAYTPENWEVVLGLVESGRAAVDAAADKDGVDNAVTTACNAIDEVPKESEMEFLPFVVGYEGISHDAASLWLDLAELVRSLEELQKLCDEHNYFPFQENKPDYHWELSKKIRDYDEIYFDKNTLILYFFTESSLDIGTTQADTIIVQDKVLTLNMLRISTGAGKDAMTFWAFLIEVNQSDVASVTEIRAVQNLEIAEN